MRSDGFRGKPLAYLDTETTGLDPLKHEILEIALLAPAHTLPLSCDLVLPGWRLWVTKIKPLYLDNAMQEAIDINGYTPEAWKDALDPHEVVSTLIGRVKNVTIAGHNVDFDCKFLQRFATLHASYDLDIKYRIDTTTLIWEKLVPLGLKSNSLTTACRVCGISNEHQHTAAGDVIRTKALVDFLLSDDFVRQKPIVRRNIALEDTHVH